MSNNILNLVRDARIGDSTAKEILKVIADQSNDAGTGVWSSYAYIAWCVERGRSTVIEKCALLRDMGVLSWKRGKTNLWSVNTSRLEELAEIWGKDIESPDGGLPEVEEVQTTDNKVQTLDPSPLEPEEPTYVEDVDGVPDERLIEWIAFMEGWKTCFPNKAQPRKSNTKLRNKFYTRLKDEGFRGKWKSALWLTKNLTWAQKEGWFKADWFLKNDDNYMKLLDGTFDFKSEQLPETLTQPTVHETVDVDEWRRRRYKMGAD